MPLMNSMGAFKLQYNYNATTPSWMEVYDLKMNSSSPGSSNSIIPYSNDVIEWGNFNGSGLARPYFARLDYSNGSLTSNKVFGETGILGESRVNGIAVDEFSNLNVIINNSLSVYQYDGSGSLLLGKTFTGMGSINAIGSDNNGYLYLLGSSSLNDIQITKIDNATYSVIWAKTYTSTLNGFTTNTKITCDGSGNIYVTGTGSRYNIMKFDSSGNISWQKYHSISAGSYFNATNVDSSGNIYIAYTETTTTIVNKLIKIDSSGAKVAEYTSDIDTMVYTSIELTGTTLYLKANLSSTSVISTVSTSFTPLQSHTVNFGYTTAINKIIGTSDYSYSLGTIFNSSNSKTAQFVLKVPADTDLTTSTAYSFTITSEDSTTYSFSNTLSITSATNMVLTSSSAFTLSTSSFTASSLSVTTSSATPTDTAETPFTYVKNLS